VTEFEWFHIYTDDGETFRLVRVRRNWWQKIIEWFRCRRSNFVVWLDGRKGG